MDGRVETSVVHARLVAADAPSRLEIRVDGVSAAAKLYVSPWVQRLVPTLLAVPLALVAGRLRWRTSRRMRKKTLRWARLVLGAPDDAPDVRGLARRACSERTVADVLIWRPWALRRTPFYGFDRVLALRGSGRGAILSPAHTITLSGFSVACAAAGVAPYTARAADSLGQRLHGYPGLWKAARVRNGEAAGIRYIERPGTYEVFRALLARGEVCTLVFDAPGSRPTRWGGGIAELSLGPATLAFETGVPVVPVVARRERWRFVCRALEPLEPTDFANPVALHDHLAEVLATELLPYLPQTFPTGRLRPASPSGA